MATAYLRYRVHGREERAEVKSNKTVGGGILRYHFEKDLRLDGT